MMRGSAKDNLVAMATTIIASENIFVTAMVMILSMLSQDGEAEDDEYYDYDDGTGESEEKEEVVVKVSPSLPTSSGHIEQQMLNDAVSLNEGMSEEDIKKVLETFTNITSSSSNKANLTSTSTKSATADAEASAEAITAATAAVSAVLSSPESVEARKCCASIMKVFHEECDNPDDEEYNDRRLFIIVCVIALCGMVKSLIRHFKIHWMPEAGGCILVGVIGGVFLQFIPHFDFGFQHDMFLRVMVPPIVFEAALNIDKRAFMRHCLPIVIYAVFGTLLSTLLTAAIVYYGTAGLGSWCTSIPFIESLTFGALISSIDPIAVLSVLSSMGMGDKDAIYVLIFGESLLNDGVAIVLFQTLVHFLDERLVIDGEAVWAATLHFVVIAGGSLFIGFISGVFATIYFWLMKGIQTPLVEVLMFLCWAFIPYYICDGVEWSGIVAIVAAGFFMDIFVVGQRLEFETKNDDESEVNTNGSTEVNVAHDETVSVREKLFRRIFSKEGFLSAKAKSHIGFVTEINSTLMETAIFAYLGLFLFSKRYHWSFWIPAMAVISCIVSRAIMITMLSFVANFFTHLQSRTRSMSCRVRRGISSNHNNKANNGRIIDARMQVVLVFAGLRGAMSFALVETIPLYDTVTGQGSRLKPELKAMTSASIVFTVFFLGGYTYYLMERLGMSMSKDIDNQEVEALIHRASSPATGKITTNVKTSPTSTKRNSSVSNATRRSVAGSMEIASSGDLTHRHRAGDSSSTFSTFR